MTTQQKCTILATVSQHSALYSHSEDGNCSTVLSFNGTDVYDAWHTAGLGKQVCSSSVKEVCKEV